MTTQITSFDTGKNPFREAGNDPEAHRNQVTDRTDAATDGDDRCDRSPEHSAKTGKDVGMIAHNLNNLLMGIQGNVSLMLGRMSPKDELYWRLKVVDQYISCGAKLTMQLLEMTGKGSCETEPQPPILPGFHEESILLVDDEHMVRDVTTEMLKTLGCSVLVARNGEEAIKLFKEHHFTIDLVILDMIMPDMSGSDTFKRLKIINPGIKVLLSSGYCMDDQARRILQEGGSGFIQKPFNTAMLSAKIREITSNQ